MREYIWLAANDNGGTSELPLAVVANVNTTPVLYMVHADHLGRPIRMTDATKTTVWQAVYKPYGEVYSTSGTAALDLRFPGQFFGAAFKAVDLGGGIAASSEGVSCARVGEEIHSHQANNRPADVVATTGVTSGGKQR